MIPANLVFVNYDINAKDSENTIEEGKDLTMKLMWLEFFISLILIPCFIFIKN